MTSSSAVSQASTHDRNLSNHVSLHGWPNLVKLQNQQHLSVQKITYAYKDYMMHIITGDPDVEPDQAGPVEGTAVVDQTAS